jgi:hypothetical protein
MWMGTGYSIAQHGKTRSAKHLLCRFASSRPSFPHMAEQSKAHRLDLRLSLLDIGATCLPGNMCCTTNEELQAKDEKGCSCRKEDWLGAVKGN